MKTGEEWAGIQPSTYVLSAGIWINCRLYAKVEWSFLPTERSWGSVCVTGWFPCSLCWPCAGWRGSWSQCWAALGRRACCRLTAWGVHTPGSTGIHRILEGSGSFANLPAGCCELFQTVTLRGHCNGLGWYRLIPQILLVKALPGAHWASNLPVPLWHHQYLFCQW